MRNVARYMVVLLSLVAGSLAVAGTPTVTYHGRLLDNTGTAVTQTNVQFFLQVFSADGRCLMYSEVYQKNLALSAGAFSISLNDGTATTPNAEPFSINRVFQNQGTFTFAGGKCSSGPSTYTPAAGEGRLLKVGFNDSTFAGWEVLPSQNIAMAPQAIESMTVGGFDSGSLLRTVDVSGNPAPATALSPTQYTEFQNLLSGSSSNYLPSASAVPVSKGGTGLSSAGSANQVLGMNNAGSNLEYKTLTAGSGVSIVHGAGTVTISNTGGSGTVTSVGVTPPLAVLTPTSTPALSIAKATAAVDGYLAAADFTTFNNKLSAVAGSPLASANMWVGNAGGNAAAVSMSGDATLSNTGALALSATGVGAGTYTSLTVDTTGRVTAASNPTIANNSVMANVSGSAAAPTATTISALLNSTVSNTQGAIMYRDASGWTALTPGTSGTFLQTQGAGANPQWATPTAGTGTVTSVVAGTGLTGGTITTTGTIGLGTELTGVNGLSTTGLVKRTGAGTYTAGGASLTADVSGVLPIANGGTNSSTTLNNARLMVSSGGAIVEAAAMTDGQVVVGKTGSAPQLVTMSGDATISNTGAITLGTVPVSKGGTGATSFANFSSIASDGSGNQVAVPGSTSGTMLQWTVTGPAWSSAVYPTSTTAKQLLFSSANNVVGGITTANNSVLTTDGTGTPSWATIASDTFTQYALLAGRSGGQTLIGGTANSENLTLNSTSGATKGFILLNPSGGNVGIGTSTPAAKLDINGAVRLAMDATACSATNEGAQRYNAGTMEYCNSSAWTPLAAAGSGVTSVTAGTGLTGGTITGTGTIGLGTELTGLNGLSTTGVVKRTGAGTYTAAAASLTADVSGVLPVANGGTNSSTTLNNSRLMVSTGGAIVEAAAMTDGQFVVGKTGSAPQLVTMSGDATVTNAGAIALASTAVTPGSYGSATQVGTFTVDAKGRLTAAANATITGVTPGGAAGGVLSGTYPNPDFASIANNNVLANTSGSAGVPAATTVTALIDSAISNTQGSIMFRNSTGWVALAPGTSGKVLQTQGAAADPQWATAATGTVTSITAGTGLTGGTITGTGTIGLGTELTGLNGLSTTGFVKRTGAGTYSTGSASLTADVTGILPIANGGTNSSTTLNNSRLMVSSGGAIVEAAAMTDGQFVVGKTGSAPQQVTMSGDATVSNTGGITLASTAVTPASYGSATQVATFTVDAKGRLTAAGNTTITGVAPGGAAGGVLSGTYPNPGFASIANNSVLANVSGSAGAPAATTVTGLIDSAISNTQGSIMFRNSTGWVALAPGTSGKVLQTQGAAADPQWATAATGTVTSITAGTGLTGGTITGTGTIGLGTELTGVNGLSTTGVVKRTGAGTYTAAAASLTADVSGVLPVANGGTNSSTTLNNSRLMVSSGNAIVEAAAMTDGQIVVGKTGSAPQLVTMSGGATISNTGVVTLGTVGVANGGTGATSFANYSVIASNGSGNQVAVAGSTTGTHLQWTVTGPAWTTATFPATTTSGQLLYSSANNVVGGLTSANSAVLTTNGSGVPSWTTIATDTFTQYAMLAGRSGGQTIYGGTANSENLTLTSTSGATKGYVLINSTGGNVGIGTTTPGSPLEVVGDIKATTFTSTSDRRLKTNIRTVAGLEKITKLRGVTFNWIKDGRPEVGFIAQEVEQVFPELVTTDPHSGMKAVRYQGVIGPLVEATKELKLQCDMTAAQSNAANAMLGRRIQSLETENQNLKLMLQKMDERINALEAKASK